MSDSETRGCRQCGKPRPQGYGVTCGRSQCQDAEDHQRSDVYLQGLYGCNYCGAEIGKPCITGNRGGKPKARRAGIHKVRRRAALNTLHAQRVAQRRATTHKG